MSVETRLGGEGKSTAIPLMLRWLVRFAGLAKPRRFERTFLIVFALMVGLLAGAALVYHGLAGGLTRDTPRFWYFLYLAGLLAIAVVGMRWRRMAAVALSLAALELGLGVGSNVLQRYGYAAHDLLPANESPQARRNWHPLLQDVARPGTVRRLSDGEARFNSQGLRGPERSPDDLRGKTVIALFGGSTAEDVAVPDGRTWSDRLEQILGRDRFAVVNHGSAYYSTVQLVLQTAFYANAFGVRPHCAVYYVGGVDVQLSHFANLDPGYADYHTPSLIDSFGVRRIDEVVPPISPTLRYLGRLIVLAFDTARPPSPPRGHPSDVPDASLEAIFARNIRTISAINREHGVKTVWVGEIVDLLTLSADSVGEPWIVAPFVRAAAFWPLLSHLNGVLQSEAAALGDVYIDIPVKNFRPDDFVDGEHFSVDGAQKFASLVAPAIEAACRR